MTAFEYPDTTVLRWVDGDTVDLRIASVHDFGFRFRYGMTFEDRFRLYGINTPERGQPLWAEATAECNRLAPPGTLVTARTHKDYRDKYGRWLAEVWIGDVLLNEHLVAAGLAVRYFG